MNDNYNEDEFRPRVSRSSYPRYDRTAPYPRWSPFVSNYRDHNGVWIAYDYDTGPYVIMLFEDVVPASKYTSQNYGKVAFWPFGMSLHQGIDWWNEKVVEEASEQLGVDVYEHFHLMEDPVPYCETINNGYVEFNSSSELKACPKCLAKLQKGS